MSNGRTKTPSYRLHKASGQAVVTLSGQDIYLGNFGTKKSKAEYDRVVGEWLAAGRTTRRAIKDEAAPLLVVINGFRKSGLMPAGKAQEFHAVMKIMLRLYGRKPATAFDALAAEVVRDNMVALGWKRRTVNQRMFFVRRIIRWGVTRKLTTATQLAEIMAIESLRYGQTTAPESMEVQPVAKEIVDATIEAATPTVAAMIRVQAHSGMRAGELCQMRQCDLDMSDPTCWIFRPATHKTKSRGKIKEIALGQVCIGAIRPLLKPDVTAHIFSPAQAEAERRAAKSAKRKTRLGQGNSPGTNRKARPHKTPGDRYTTNSYRRAIEYATHQAFPPPASLARKRGESKKQWADRLGPKQWAKLIAHRKAHHWHPHQLRHSFGSLVINEFSELHAQKALGQSTVQATRIYAKLSLDKAREVARKIG